jgi:hypothetical protein
VPIGLVTRKRLWNNAGKVCAFPGCIQRLVVPVEEGDDEIVVGKECHIVAQREEGPRAPDSLTDEERQRWAHLIADRDGYANLILLCGIHHDVIDGDGAAYTVECLVAMKQDHETAVDDAVSPERRNQDVIEIRYAAIVDGWAERIDLDYWDSRMLGLVADAAIREDVFDTLATTRDWILRRVWPRTIPALEEAFLNFRRVSEDLESVAGWFSTRRHGRLFVDRVYKEVSGPEATPRNVELLMARSEYMQDLTADLTIELTRAVNLVCERAREHLWPTYRLEEGYTTVGLGLNEHLSYMTLRPLYPPDVKGVPYPGLELFLTERAKRDFVRGSGFPPSGSSLPGVRPSWEDDGNATP